MDTTVVTSTAWTDWSCTVRITVDEPSSLGQAAALTASLMFDVARAVDRFDPDSELSRANDRAGTLTPVSRLCRQIVHRALELAAETEGACDPTTGAFVLAAGYHRDIAEVRASPPATATAVESLRRPDWRAVHLDSRFDLLTVPAGMRLDLGAVAKAWTADEAARRIALVLGCSALVEVGGDLAVAGGRADWQVLVSELAEQDGQCINLRHGGVATSSTLARRWTSSTGPAHHIIDPRTRRPATSTWRSATVWAPTTAQANAWSTAAIVLGTDVLPLLERRTLAARLVDTTGRVRFAGDWPIPPTNPDVDRRLAVAS